MFSEVIPQDIVQRNLLQVYQITITNWGNTGTGADKTSLVSPRFEFPVAGISLDPESTVERVVLRPSVKGQVNPSSDIKDFDIPIDKDTPLGGRFDFPRIREFDGGWGLVATREERYGDQYISLDGSAQPFGGAVMSPDLFVKPVLRALLYLDAGRPDIKIPRRYPFRSTLKFAAFTGLGHKNSIGFFPLAGRKHLRIVAFQTAGMNPGTLHIRGLTTSASAVVIPGLPAEYELVSPLAVNPTNGNNATAKVDDPLTQYLHLLGEAEVGNSMTILIEARD